MSLRLRQEIQALPRAAVLSVVGPAQLAVVAGILWRPGGQVLISERLGDSPFAGLWEFPGGKIAPGEEGEAALLRELNEEIGVEAHAAKRFMQLEHRYPGRQVMIEFFLVETWSGVPRGLEGQALRWVQVEKLDPEELLPADAPVVAALRTWAARASLRGSG